MYAVFSISQFQLDLSVFHAPLRRLHSKLSYVCTSLLTQEKFPTSTSAESPCASSCAVALSTAYSFYRKLLPAIDPLSQNFTAVSSLSKPFSSSPPGAHATSFAIRLLKMPSPDADRYEEIVIRMLISCLLAVLLCGVWPGSSRVSGLR